MTRQRNDLDVRTALLDLDRRFSSVQPRHRNIHEHDIRLELLRLLPRSQTIISLADDLHVRLLVDQPLQTFLQNAMILSQKDSQFFHAATFAVKTRREEW